MRSHCLARMTGVARSLLRLICAVNSISAAGVFLNVSMAYDTNTITSDSNTRCEHYLGGRRIPECVYNMW